MRPTFKIVLFSRPNKDGLFPVKLRATFMRQTKDYTLHRACLPDDWDSFACRFRKSHPGWAKENDMLRTYEQRAADAIREFEREGVRFTFEAFEARVFQDRVKTGAVVWKWMLDLSASMREGGSLGNSVFYKNVASVVRAFAPAATLHDVDADWLRRFERWMRKHRSVTDGGISINLRTLRAACNKAVKSKVMPKGWRPFEDFALSHLKKAKAKRAIPLEDLWALRDAECCSQGERFALDMFMLSFYLRGMNLADLAELRAGNVRDMRVEYVRKKTHKEYSVKLHAKAGAILDRYRNTGGYLLPVYTDGVHVTDVQKFDRLQKVAKQINRALREIAARAGLNVEGLSFYVARHTYASAHKMRGTSIEVIRELMGHSDYRTSEHYLSAFGDSALDDADMGLFG